MANRLHEKYNKEIREKLVKELKLSNVMEVPKLIKIVLNAGVGGFRDDKEAVEVFKEEISQITGQKPAIRKSKKSEAGFKVRKGETVGLIVTLRGEKMWSFFDKFVSIVIPRIKDFKGTSSTSFDGSGNYSMGITEHTVFPEINVNATKGTRGLEVTFVTSSDNVKHSRALFEALGMPFVKD